MGLLLPGFPAAEPIIAEAEAALNSLDKGSLGELKSFGSPAAEIVQVGGTFLPALPALDRDSKSTALKQFTWTWYNCLCYCCMVQAFQSQPCLASVPLAGCCSMYDPDSSWWQDP